MSQSQRRRARREQDRASSKEKIPADASVIVTINVPSGNYEQQVQRVLRLLGQAGYDCHAMTGEFILKMADDIRRDLEAAQQAEALVADAAIKAQANPAAGGANTTEGEQHGSR